MDRFDDTRPGTPVARMRNLGPASARMLRTIGIQTADDLADVGAVAAFTRLRDETGHRPSLNLLWAMEGALLDIDWRHLPPALMERRRAQLGSSAEAPSDAPCAHRSTHERG